LQFCHEWLNGKVDFILQTSGSTGTPKKISVTRDQLKASATLSTSYLGLKKEFTALVCLDTKYVAGIMMLVRSLEVGMNMYVVEPSANPFDDTVSEDVTQLILRHWFRIRFSRLLIPLSTKKNLVQQK
jgi:O-succinylbenzoic acid--CoA ligase